MRGHNIRLLAECVLFELYDHAIVNGGEITSSSLHNRFRKFSVTSTLLGFALNDLMARDFAVRRATRAGDEAYEISKDGYEYVRYRSGLTKSAINQYSLDKGWLAAEEQPGDDAPDTDDRNHGHQSARRNFSGDDDEWEPLPVDREAEGYKEAEDAIETALNEIEGNNGYAESEPEERNHIVASVKEGLRQIREGMPSRAQVLANLVQPLRTIAKKFSDAAMGIAAKSGVEKLLAWLGTLF